MGKIRLLHLIPSFERAGAESVVSNICNFLPTSDYEIHILLLEDSTAGIIRIKPSINVQIHLSGGFPFKIRKNLPRFNLKSLISIRKIIRSIKPDIIHCHLIESYLTLNLVLISFRIPVRFVHTAHTNSDHYKSNSLNSRIGLLLEKFSFRVLKARFVCVSEGMFNYMKRHYSPNQLDLAINSVDTEYYKKEVVAPFDLMKLNVPDEAFVILHIGRFAVVKNHPLMFNAIKLLKEKGKKVVLLCVGSRGGLLDEYKEWVDKNDLNSFIYFVGEVDDTRPFIASSNLGLLPSYHEGLSLALLEMFSMELPVLVSKIPSSEEVVRGITDRLFIDVNDASQLADKVEDAMMHYDDFLEIGMGMRNKVNGSFSVKRLAVDYDNIYKKLISNK